MQYFPYSTSSWGGPDTIHTYTIPSVAIFQHSLWSAYSHSLQFSMEEFAYSRFLTSYWQWLARDIFLVSLFVPIASWGSVGVGTANSPISVCGHSHPVYVLVSAVESFSNDCRLTPRTSAPLSTPHSITRTPLTLITTLTPHLPSPLSSHILVNYTHS